MIKIKGELKTSNVATHKVYDGKKCPRILLIDAHINVALHEKKSF